jgi:hypothetical protein
MNGSNNDPTTVNFNSKPNNPVAKKNQRILGRQNTTMGPSNNSALKGENQRPIASLDIKTTATPGDANQQAKANILAFAARPDAADADAVAMAPPADETISPSSPPSFFQQIGQTFKQAGASVAALGTAATSAVSSLSVPDTSQDQDPGPAIWGGMNAVSFIILTILIVLGLCYGATHIGNVQHVKKHWKHYRCQPAYMPFAGFYGFNVGDNFEFCMKNIFESNTGDITSSFGSVLGMFTSVIGIIMEAVNALRTSISTMGGGINVIFQDFTDRIKTFFYQLQVSAMRIKMLIGRMYAIMFAVLYMGMSSMTAGMNFSNTVLFSFLDTFCFPPETPIHVKGRGLIPLADVKVGDSLLPGGARVTAKFHFNGEGQGMVNLGEVTVSTNHYVKHSGRWIMAADHPDAIPLGPYGRRSLICLNTDTHTIPIGGFLFRDYDETNTADKETMRFVESRVNGSTASAAAESAAAAPSKPYTFTDSTAAFQRSSRIKLKDGSYKAARNLQLGDELSTGSKVVGILHRQQTEFCCVPTAEGKTEFLSPATLLWDPAANKWQRAGEVHTSFSLKQQPTSPLVFLSFIVTPNSQLELESGLTVRDYMELCSPDTEALYARDLAAITEENE